MDNMTDKLPDPTFVTIPAELEATPAPLTPHGHELVELMLRHGDLSKLSVEERNSYYLEVCRSTGLNPLTRPFEYLVLSGKLTLYARKDATDQLRARDKISVVSSTASESHGCYVVTTKVQNAAGRTDVSTGAVFLGGARGEAVANLMMKAETKAKRRATLSICGLGMLDETEVEHLDEVETRPIRDAVPPHNPQTGELEGFARAEEYMRRWNTKIERAHPADYWKLLSDWTAETEHRAKFDWPAETSRETYGMLVASSLRELKASAGK
jgi:hypothetical protein